MAPRPRIPIFRIAFIAGSRPVYRPGGFTNMQKVFRILIALSLAVSALPALAQTWPHKPVRFILSLGPGSGADIGARLYADRLTKMWGQPVVVENRPGGDGVIAINAVIQAKDDTRCCGARRRTSSATRTAWTSCPTTRRSSCP